MKELWTIVKKELVDNETIFITRQAKLDDKNDNEWWKFEEFTYDELFNNYSGKEKVKRFWHEDGLCIILK